jgi:antitoxin component YwqK of YwqJK toxin-antitoxin module
MEKLKIDWDDLSHFEYLVVYNGVLFTGIAVEYYDDDLPATETEVINGRRSGWSREWYLNGQLKIEEYYINSILDGIYREWFENGQLKIEKKVVEGIEVESKEWDEQGNLIETFTMDKNQPLFELLQISLDRRDSWLEYVKNWESKTIYVENGKLVEK